MNRRAKITASCAAMALALGLTACSTIAEPDKVGLYYLMGSSDGHKFGECINPGATGDAEWNNEIIYLPTSLDDWLIDDVEHADDKEPLIVAAAPQEGQPSGIAVRINVNAKYVLNTFCDAQGGVVREFWEKVGRRYGADTEAGWKEMLLKTFSTTLKSIAKDEVRKYSADDLVANKDGIQATVLKAISEKFSVEVTRLVGGPFFCGPSFNRSSKECPAIELQLVGVELADKGLQDARNEKQKAVELAAAELARAQGKAAAMVAEAQGVKDAADKLNTLYNTPGWVALQKQIEAGKALVEACKAAKECRLVVGADGTLVMAQ